MRDIVEMNLEELHTSAAINVIEISNAVFACPITDFAVESRLARTSSAWVLH
jgi:hypothetical protein